MFRRRRIKALYIMYYNLYYNLCHNYVCGNTWTSNFMYIPLYLHSYQRCYRRHTTPTPKSSPAVDYILRWPDNLQVFGATRESVPCKIEEWYIVMSRRPDNFYNHRYALCISFFLKISHYYNACMHCTYSVTLHE
jgi:hypothetical protein